MRVAIIVLNWNQAALTLKCLDHLKHVPEACLTIVVDNGSQDNSVAQLTAHSAVTQLVALPTNAGFAGGMNAGLAIAMASGVDYAWLLNNDAFVAPDSLTHLLDRLDRDSTLVAVGPRLVYEDGRPQAAGARFSWSDGTFTPLSTEEFAAQSEHDNMYLVGAAPLIRVAALRDVGVFDADFFAYMEDADLGLRLRRRGRIAVVPDAVVAHALGATSGGALSAKTQFLLARNSWLCLTRNAPPGSTLARWLRFTAAALQLAEMWEMRGHLPIAAAIMAGVSAARHNRFGGLPSTIEPSRLERLLMTHPTRFRGACRAMADLVDGATRRVMRGAR